MKLVAAVMVVVRVEIVGVAPPSAGGGDTGGGVLTGERRMGRGDWALATVSAASARAIRAAADSTMTTTNFSAKVRPEAVCTV